MKTVRTMSRYRSGLTGNLIGTPENSVRDYNYEDRRRATNIRIVAYIEIIFAHFIFDSP